MTCWSLVGCQNTYTRWMPRPEAPDKPALIRILGEEAAEQWLHSPETRRDLPTGMTSQEFYQRMRPRGVSPLASEAAILEAATDNDCRLRCLHGREFRRLELRGAVAENLLSQLSKVAPDEENAWQRETRECLEKSIPVAGDPSLGLCLSGGGIRSAAFATGVLRGLHDIGLLRRVGYLSTVSGGGFAGAWYQTHLDDDELFRPGSPHLERLLKGGSYLWNGHFSRSGWELGESIVLHALYLTLTWVYNFAVDLQKNDLSYFRGKYRDAIEQAFLYDDVSREREDGLFSGSIKNWLSLACVLAMWLWPDAIAAEFTRFSDALSSDPVDPVRPNKVRLIGAIMLSLLPVGGPAISGAGGTDRGWRNIAKLSPLKPYWIANAHVSLTHSNSPFIKSRSGDAFEFTADRCGADAVGYVAPNLDDEDDSGRPWQQVATICAISGAAVDSESLQQGVFASLAMKVLGLDLGYWVPAWGRGWVKGDDGALWNSICYLWNVPLPTRWLTKLLGNPSTHGLHEEAANYLLTDGGHFDNLGLYALVRRGCRTIIVCDATAEPSLSDWSKKSTAERAAVFASFHDSAVKILTDFGASISLDVTEFDPVHKSRSIDGQSFEGPILVMRGKIENLPFFHVTGDPASGIARDADLIYIRAAFDHGDATPSRDAFVAREKATNPDFPNVPTSDQDFTESQMAALMQLGYRAVLNQQGRFPRSAR